MNEFDSLGIDFLNQFATRSYHFDTLVAFVSSNHLFKGAVMLLLMWWGWFRVSDGQSLARLHLISTLLGCIVAVVLARCLALLLPFRIRPLHEEGLDFTLPHGVVPENLNGWSSFPSDHAVLFMTLVVGIFFVSRRLGVIALFYIVLVIFIPRIYLGLHYPTDILVGAFLGLLVALVFNSVYLRERFSRPIINLSQARPEWFYPGFFFVSYQVADMFDSSREVLWFVMDVFVA